MKAKDYATMINEAKPDDIVETLCKICGMFVAEISTIAKSRNVSSDSAMVAVLEELNVKWIAFARRTNGLVLEDGFRILLEDNMPVIHQYWMHHKRK